ncbi:conserved hypothetical protein [Magnetococcus marinus MC-1]|uniref:ATP-grasp domain-containing protein n=1 Tax=Magnetococcus marinus (strain ATCC BAA-1437 / JCM 17883 / MC-1) TaxID=156889 RepID=A0L6U4_MAGMM|nr:hypothetical protein [Magnetococcus marinus]ABK43687.1 conserved hypothetical protein [Magnetococcus marinus MC-1]
MSPPTTPHRVLLLGVDTPIGLTLVRELAKAGIQVYAIARQRHGVGLHSRYLHLGVYHDSQQITQLDLINQLAQTHQIPYLMTVSEPDILWLQAHGEQLQGIRPLIPAPHPFSQVLDKQQTLLVARKLGIQTPQSWQISHPHEIADLVAQVPGYPVILKWADPQAALPRLRAHKLTLEKYRYVDTPQALVEQLARYTPTGHYPQVSCYCPGVGLGQMIYMHQGQATLTFQHQRLHEWPPEGGVSTLCESLPQQAHPALLAQSIALLQALEWQGAAMVEYRFDPKTGQTWLMEVNGRFWGSQPLAYYAGAHFAVATYWWQGLRQPPPPSRQRAGLRCQYTIPALHRLQRIVGDPELIQNRSLRFSVLAELMGFVLGVLDPRLRYYIFAWDDPKPFWVDTRQALNKLWRQMRKRFCWRGCT